MFGQTVYVACWTIFSTLYTSTYPASSVSVSSCPTSLLSFLPSLHAPLPPLLPLLLPASCCSGPLGSYRSPSDKRMDRTTPENNLATDLDLFVLWPTLSPMLPCYRQTLSLSLFYPWGSVHGHLYQPRLTVTQTRLVCSTWATTPHTPQHRARRNASWGFTFSSCSYNQRAKIITLKKMEEVR